MNALKQPFFFQTQESLVKNYLGQKFHNLMGQGDNRRGWAHLGSILDTPYGPPTLPGMILSVQPGVIPLKWLGVTQNQKIFKNEITAKSFSRSRN